MFKKKSIIHPCYNAKKQSVLSVIYSMKGERERLSIILHMLFHTIEETKYFSSQPHGICTFITIAY